MAVVGSDREHVGTVDHVDGQRIKLAKSDPAAGGEHHYLHLETVEGAKVVLNRTGAQARVELDVREL